MSAHTSTTSNQQINRLDKIRSILLPTDFSEAAHHAFLYALSLAEALGASVHLVHVYSIGHIPLKLVPASFVEALKQEKMDQAMVHVQTYAREAQESFGTEVKLTFELQQGHAKNTLIELSQSGQYDLIVMGTQGATSEYSKAFGSVTMQVLQQAACPVWVIPEEATFTSPDRLLFAMNIEEQDQAAIDELFAFCCRFGAKLTCCHVGAPGEALSREQENRLSRLREMEETDLVNFVLLEASHPLQGIQAFMSQYKVDLLVMLTHKRLFANPRFEDSLTQEMAMQSERPLLVLHGGA